MTAPALDLLAELRREGLRLVPDGDAHLRIAPPERLTPALRQRVIAAKSGLIVALRMQGDLERHIRAMAARWRYTADDLVHALEDAGRQPDAWLACYAWDEELTAKCDRAGLSWPLWVH